MRAQALFLENLICKIKQSPSSPRFQALVFHVTPKSCLAWKLLFLFLSSAPHHRFTPDSHQLHTVHTQVHSPRNPRWARPPSMVSALNGSPLMPDLALCCVFFS